MDLLLKMGYYSLYQEKTSKGIKYIVDSGKTIYIDRLKKYIINPYRDVKEFKTIEKAKEYVTLKLKKKTQEKNKKLSNLPKSLYLVLIKEESTGKSFVKVGFTTKRFIMRRFSKVYGYDGYVVETILRRIDTPNAEKLESDIKNKIKENKSIKKYRPILESFSGYSECFNILNLNQIISIFDRITSES
jgi:nitrogenase molybdenum-iron protein alpha/beta subunit